MKEIIFGVIGGLALFIYGMNLMGEGLKKAAGERMRNILEAVTTNPLIGVAVGALVTAIIQSSSATTVMVISFVNARLMTLSQAIGVIMGANIGTTMTAQLIAFKIGHYAYLAAGLGFALFFFGKKKTLRYLGQVLFGFGVLFIGLNTMSDVLEPLARNETSRRLITNMSKNPVWGLLTGTVMTMIVQSSSAVIGVLQSLASQPVEVGGTVRALIPLKAAVPILFGSNIGTTITAALASIGSNRTAKRAAFSHTLFNVFGTIVGLLFLPLFVSFVYRVSPQANPGAGLTEASVVSRQIANAHTFFNVINTILWLPFVGFLAKLVTKLFPGKDVYLERGVKFIDLHVINNAELALDLSVKELSRMGNISLDMFQKVEADYLPAEQNKKTNLQIVQDSEEILDDLQDDIIHYLSSIVSQNTLTERQSVILANLMHVAGDLERIGDHCMNLAELFEYMNEEKIVFSDQAMEDIKKIFSLTKEMFNLSLQALRYNDFSAADQVLQLEKRMDATEKESRLDHLERLNAGMCNPKSAVVYSELMKNLERIADHCNNVAEAVLDQEPHHRSAG